MHNLYLFGSIPLCRQKNYAAEKTMPLPCFFCRLNYAAKTLPRHYKTMPPLKTNLPPLLCRLKKLCRLLIAASIISAALFKFAACSILPPTIKFLKKSFPPPCTCTRTGSVQQSVHNLLYNLNLLSNGASLCFHSQFEEERVSVC